VTTKRPDIPAKLGKYELRDRLGSGGMGVVYRAYDPRIDRTVALKVVEKRGLDPEKRDGVLHRFMVEARAAGRLMHPNIVSVFEFDEDDDAAFIAMEFVDGTDLKTYVEQQGARLPLDSVRAIIKQLLAALEYSHSQGVVHRDVKPANVFVMRDGTIKLGDFGIAKLAAASTSMTREGTTVFGTPNYMSPEHFTETELDGRSDLFSVGVMLYELLTRKKPFSGDLPTILNQILNQSPEPPSSLNPALPSRLDVVVRKAMAKDRTKRFATAADFAAALEIAFTPESASPPPPPKRQKESVGWSLETGEPVSASPKISGSRPVDPEVAQTVRTDRGDSLDSIVSLDGHGDYRTLAEAIQRAEPFGRILVDPGTYEESLYIAKPLAIVGRGQEGAVVLSHATSHCLKIASDGVRLHNLTLQGKATVADRPTVIIGRGNVQFEDCDISSQSGLCISVRGRSAAPHFRKCRIHDSQGVGIHFAGGSTGKLDNCFMFGHSSAAVKVDKGAHVAINGGSIRDAVVRPPSTVDAGPRTRKAASGPVRIGNLFADAGSDVIQGGLRGGLIGLAAAVLLVALGIGWAAPAVGIGAGMIVGLTRAKLPGVLIGCLVALVFWKAGLPEPVLQVLRDHFGHWAGGAAAETLNLVARSALIGAATLVVCGIYLQLMERSGKL